MAQQVARSPLVPVVATRAAAGAAPWEVVVGALEIWAEWIFCGSLAPHQALSRQLQKLDGPRWVPDLDWLRSGCQG